MTLVDPQWKEFYRLSFDGGIKGGNPGGVINFGWAIQDETDAIIESGCWSGVDPEYPITTNNVAEYLGLRAGLRGYLRLENEKKLLPKPLIINGDSKLIINHVNQDWACREPTLKVLCKQVVQLIALIPVEHWIFWIPREHNSIADELGRKANESRNT